MTFPVLGNTRWHVSLWMLVTVIVWLIWWLAPVMMPFAVAVIMAWLGDPLTGRLEKLGMSRSLAVSIVFVLLLLAMTGTLLLLIPLIMHQLERLAGNLPAYIAWIGHTALPYVQRMLHLGPSILESDTLITTFRENIGSIGSLLGRLLRPGMSAVIGLTHLVLIPVLAFYLLRDWHSLLNWIDRMLPRLLEPVICRLARESNAILRAFVRGQLMVMLLLGVFYGVSLGLLGLSIGPLIGMVAGALSFVPYLGFIAGFSAALMTVLVQHGDRIHILLVVVVFIMGQLLEGYVLVPRLVGEKIGLHPVIVIFALLTGSHLAGFTGILMALPGAAVARVLLRYLSDRYQQSVLYTSSTVNDRSTDRTP